VPILLAYWFGRGEATDIYYFAWAVFALAGSLVFSAFQDSALVPILAEQRVRERSRVPQLLGSVLAHAWVVGGVTSVAVGALALAWFAARYDGPQFVTAATMVAPFSLYLVALCTRTFFGAVLVGERHYVAQPIAGAVGIGLNLLVLGAFHRTVGIAIVPVGALIGETAGALFLAWFTTRVVGVRIQLTFDRPPALRELAPLVASEVGGGAVTRVNPIIDQLMASMTGVIGGGTLLRLSGDVASVPTGLVSAALLPVLLARLADDHAHGDLATFRRNVVQSLAWVVAALTACALALHAVRVPLLRLVFLRGEMDAEGVNGMATLLPYHLVGLAPFGALLVLVRAHVALKNSRIMVVVGIFNAACNALFNVLLMNIIGLEGLALSTSLVQLAVAVVLWHRLDSRISAMRANAA
jgi:putative peptidoglycan lipid II flippase